MRNEARLFYAELFLQTTETGTPAVLDLTRDICIDPPAVALDLTSDNSLPTVSRCNSKDRSSVMYNQSIDKISSSVELQEIVD